jgi:hypothetical protein
MLNTVLYSLPHEAKLYRESILLVFLFALGHVHESKHDGTHFPEVSTVVRQFAIVAFLPGHCKQKLGDGTEDKDFCM